MPTQSSAPSQAPVQAPTHHAPPGTLVFTGNIVFVSAGYGVWINIQSPTVPTSSKVAVSCKRHNINTKRLADIIEQAVSETVDDFVSVLNQPSMMPGDTPKRIDCTLLVEYMDAFMNELVANRIITHYDVISDARNNTQTSLDTGRTVMDITFKQFNCLNTSVVQFTFTRTT